MEKRRRDTKDRIGRKMKKMTKRRVLEDYGPPEFSIFLLSQNKSIRLYMEDLCSIFFRHLSRQFCGTVRETAKVWSPNRSQKLRVKLHRYDSYTDTSELPYMA